MMRVVRRVTVVVTLFGATTLGLLAGPPTEFKPLQFKKEGIGLAANQPVAKAFFYNGGKKVYLHDTELAVVKLKKGAQLEKAAFRPATLAADSSLKDLSETLEKAGSVIVSTSGPGALSLDRATEESMEAEYILPIVRPATAKNEGEYMVLTPRIAARFAKELATQEAVADYVKPFGLKVQRKTGIPGGYVLELAEGKVTYSKLLEAANKLYEQGTAANRVIAAYPDFVPTKKRHGGPGDPNFANQWHLKNTGQGGGTAGADVRAVEAWAVTRGTPAVRVAIIDDSVEKGHPDLAGNFVAGRYYNGITGDVEDDPSPRTGRQRHGTSCAGVAVAKGNTSGGSGVAPECGLIGVHMWDASASQTAEAFHFCAEKGAAVISCSWSWQSQSVFTEVSAAIGDVAVNGRGGKGVIILFAAGNEYGTVQTNQWFGGLPSVVCVGATNWRDNHSAYSNHGPEVTLVAPSSDSDTPDSLGIETTDNTDAMPKLPGRMYSGYATGDYTGNGETGFGGTSSATPLTAGVCGLVLSANPNLTAAQVREVLTKTADKVPGSQTPANYNPTTGHSVYYGHGRVNAARAVRAAVALRGDK